MLAIEIELLGGRYAATAHNDRSQAEWPPHPARFYSALVAALHDHEPCDPEERAALEWLEALPPPALDVDLSVTGQVGRREVRSVFVPVNDVTLVGDPEQEVRESARKVAALESEPPGKSRDTALRKARKELEKREEALAQFLKRQQEIDGAPGARALGIAVSLLPERRTRQERTFPVVLPERPTFAFLWPGADASAHRPALARLCERVTRLGHSSSLVRCALSEEARSPSLVPGPEGDFVLRTVGPGQLGHLEAAYARHQAVEGRVLPARPQRYRRPEAEQAQIPASIFSDEWIVFERIGGHRPLASRAADVTHALRLAVLGGADPGALPSVLSGLDASGSPAAGPHLAFMACPFVGHEHADGSIQGLSIVLPQGLGEPERRLLLQRLGALERDRGAPDEQYAFDLEAGERPGGGLLRLRLQRVEVSTRDALRTSRWCRPARRFLTATPIVLDRYPGNLRSNLDRTAHKAAAEAERSIADSCERIGLPRPLEVSVSLAPLLPGAQHVREFAPWPPTPGRPRRTRVHAEILFAEPVRGPVLLGAGRYLGLGLCLPVADAARRRA